MMQRKTLGYMRWDFGEKGNELSAGVLVTDLIGAPLEFRHTHPIVPTKMQKIIYGKSLGRHICINIIGVKLWEELRLKPDILLVDYRMGLNMAGVVDAPVAWLTRNKDNVAESELEIGFDGDTATISVSTPSINNLDLELAGGGQESQNEVRSAISSAAENMDILEPFDRVNKALIEATKRVKSQ